jgi:hypothetical protein
MLMPLLLAKNKHSLMGELVGLVRKMFLTGVKGTIRIFGIYS